MRSSLLCGALAAACLSLAAPAALRAVEPGCQNCGPHGHGYAHGHGHFHSHNGPIVVSEAMKAQLASQYTWHGGYYDAAWGAPVALVVPPTAHREYYYGWGVGSTRLSRINHQFTRGWRGTGHGPFYPAPAWPQDTSQLGFYYVRGPW